MNQQQPEESLTFKIGLSGTFWSKFPKYSVAVNGQSFAKGIIGSSDTGYIEFTCNLQENTEHELQIRLENKIKDDTVENEDKTGIVKDMLLNIDSIEIDGIDIGQLKWTASKFYPDDKGYNELANCVNLGWNGTYVLKFNSPFYPWLLENM
jgi:hypothetical protein